MRCEQVQSMLSAYADGELSPRQASHVSLHLASCEGCRGESAALRDVVAALRAIAEEELPTGLHGAILNALDVARPSLWQRLCAATMVFQPARPLAFGSVAAALVMLAVTSTPLHRDAPRGVAAARLPYRGATSPIAARPAATPVWEPHSVVAVIPPAAPSELAETHAGVNAPVILETASEPRAKRPEPAPRVAPANKAVVASRPAAGRAVTPENSASRRTPPVPMSTFDPLAPVLEPTGSRMDPAMANVVVVEPSATSPQPDSTFTATGPTASEMTTASAANDDLSSLRQKLAQEQIQLPAVKLKPRPRSSKHIPLIHSDF